MNWQYINNILLRRKNKIIIPDVDENNMKLSNSLQLAGTIQHNIQQFGFTFSPDAINTLSFLDSDQLSALGKHIISMCQALCGADVTYNPMYPNFPQQVMDISDADLYFNAILHYITYGNYLPQYDVNERLPLIENPDMTVIEIGTVDDAIEILTNLAKSKTSLSQTDKDDLICLLNEFKNFNEYIDDVPLKENLALIGCQIVHNLDIYNTDFLFNHYKTPTDILRLIVALSDGDISLAENTKFKSFPRRVRRLIMDLLANCNTLAEDMFRYRNRWIRVGEYLHPNEYEDDKYQTVRDVFYNIRKNILKPWNFHHQVEMLIKHGDFDLVVKLLKSRPGEFARLLDKVLRECKTNRDYNTVKWGFKDIADQVSTPVLLQVSKHFLKRGCEQNDIKVYFPKGNVTKAYVTQKKVPYILSTVRDDIATICETVLIKRFGTEKSPLGKVYISQEMKNYIVPFSQRSASNATKVLTRGSRFKINGEDNIMRGFIWWTNTKDDDRVDIDLSAAVYDNDWKYIDSCWYGHLRDSELGMYHSGDITDGGDVNGEGVAEFLDFDIEKILKNNGRYVVFTVHNYTEQYFSNLTNCRFGWMKRSDCNSGEIFEPKTVEMKIDLTAKSISALPVIFDCVERCFIWCDMTSDGVLRKTYDNNIINNLRGITALGYAMANLEKPNLYDLFFLNAMGRGEITSDRNKADIIFDTNTTPAYEISFVRDQDTQMFQPYLTVKDTPIITPYDIDVITSEYM